MTPAVLACRRAEVWVAPGTPLLAPLDWEVHPGQHWAVLGPNGAGKSTLLSLAGAVRQPSAGTVCLLGAEVGRTDLRHLRSRIGVVDAALRVPAELTVRQYAATGLSGTVQPRPQQYSAAGWERVQQILHSLRIDHLALRRIGTCSAGERGRARIARALAPDPPLLLLDEPSTGLDLGARERLIAALDRLAADQPDRASVLVTHHLEELPRSTSHVLLLRDGAVLAGGPAPEVLSDEAVSACFGLPVTVGYQGGRWSARGRGDPARVFGPDPTR